MNVQPILEASLAIQIHLATVSLAVLATLAILFARKGTAFHKTAGWIWSTMMMTTALVSFWISVIGGPFGFSFIHLFSLITLCSVPYAIISIRRGNLRAHKGAMLGVAIGGIGIAGAFTFMEGRLLHAVFFGA